MSICIWEGCQEISSTTLNVELLFKWLCFNKVSPYYRASEVPKERPRTRQVDSETQLKLCLHAQYEHSRGGLIQKEEVVKKFEEILGSGRRWMSRRSSTRLSKNRPKASCIQGLDNRWQHWLRGNISLTC